jgi:uncharacterized protein (UPF0264 family)
VPVLPRRFRRLVQTMNSTEPAGKPVPRPPALLVSVRNAREARAAIAGGCDLLDVKEPDRGPLGMAARETMASVARCAAESRVGLSPLPCSVAMGELVEWRSRTDEFSLPAGIEYLKFGSAGADSKTHWLEAWQNVQSRFAGGSRNRLEWVAVAYADWHAAGGLSPAAIIEVARESVDVVLIDTFDKNSGTLLTLLGADELGGLSRAARDAGLKMAFAGGLRRVDLPLLLDAGPDIVGVRGAACAGGRRTAPVSAAAVRSIKRELLASFADERLRRASV